MQSTCAVNYWNFTENLISSTDFQKNAKKFSKINPVKIRPTLPFQYSLPLKAKYPPFNQHSIRISSDTKFHSHIHNSVTLPILRHMKPCQILLLRILSDLFQHILLSQNFLCDQSHSRLLARTLNTRPKSDKCITSVAHFGYLRFETNNQRVHKPRCSSFCNFLEFHIISSNAQPNIFTSNRKICDPPYYDGKCIKRRFKNIFTHTHGCIQGDS